jgi:hypothetical protein
MRRQLTRVLVACLLVASAAATGWTASGGHLEGYVPAVAHVEGRFGSFWT